MIKALVPVAAIVVAAPVAHAANEITLSCTGTLSVQHIMELPNPESIVIDLDRGTALWDSDTYPIVTNNGGSIDRLLTRSTRLLSSRPLFQRGTPPLPTIIGSCKMTIISWSPLDWST
jgi:hypothetical protein